MDVIFKDEGKIRQFAQIQENLSHLESNSKEEEIDFVINEIPKSLLDQKDDLMIGTPLNYLKKSWILQKHLQDESAFLWNIFGSIYYLKLFIYEQGLITIDTIIQNSILDETLTSAKYFLPEIIEKKAEIFEKVFKDKIDINVTDKYIEEYKELRRKHFKWLRESNDYKDPFYREIEKDPLRHSIKSDNIDNFQLLLSNLNISVNSMVQESFLENIYYNPREISLIEYAIDFDSIQIVKYLLMNGAKVKSQAVFNSICNRDYEIIHMIESTNKDKFKKHSLLYSINCCNFEMTQYSIENFNYDFLDKENNIDDLESKKELINDIIEIICYSNNFIFFESVFLPFLKKNPFVVEKNIYDFLFHSMCDNPCFFLREFMKYPNIDINYHYDDENEDSILDIFVKERNVKAIELFLNDPRIDIYSQKNIDLLPFHACCAFFADLKVLRMFVKNPKFDIYKADKNFEITPFGAAATKGNFFAIEFILEKFPDYDEPNIKQLLFICLLENHLITLKLLLKYILDKNKNMPAEKVIEEIEYDMKIQYIFDEENYIKLHDIFRELKSSL